VAEATRLIAEVGITALDSGVCLLGELSVMFDAFTLSQVINFRILAYVADCYGELCLLHGAALVGNEPLMSPPSARTLEGRSRGPSPTNPT
jgi:hypothetical protein